MSRCSLRTRACPSTSAPAEVLAASLAGDVARIVLGVALLIAGVAKVGQGAAWTSQAAANQFPIVVARGVPWLELVTGATIASGVASPWPASTTTVVKDLLVFLTLPI